jgi:hypothetical protein
MAADLHAAVLESFPFWNLEFGFPDGLAQRRFEVERVVPNALWTLRT